MVAGKEVFDIGEAQIPIKIQLPYAVRNQGHIQVHGEPSELMKATKDACTFTRHFTFSVPCSRAQIFT